MSRPLNRPLRLFIVAGEHSGDRLGAALIRALREELGPEIEIKGVGGEAMAAEGVESLFPISDVAVMGVTEVIGRIPTVLRRARQTGDAALAFGADITLTIDAQDFAGLVWRRIRRKDKRAFIAHYVAPSVWAWKPWRARSLAKRINHLIALLPFEPPYFRTEGLSCDFAGHPVVERTERVGQAEAAALRGQLGVAPDARIVLLLPGSRGSEVRRLAEPFREAAERLAAQDPSLVFVAPLAGSVADEVKACFDAASVPILTLDPRGQDFETAERRKFAAFKAGHAAIAASGTVTLELAAFETPMVVGYRASRITEFVVRRMVRIETGTLVNLIVGEPAVPELFQDDCSGENLAETIASLIAEGPTRAAQLAACAAALRDLGAADAPPSRRAAQSLLAAFARHESEAAHTA